MKGQECDEMSPTNENIVSGGKKQSDGQVAARLVMSGRDGINQGINRILKTICARVVAANP